MVDLQFEKECITSIFLPFRRLAFRETAQHGVHPTGGSHRVFWQSVWLEVGPGKAAWSPPAHPRVTLTVGRTNAFA